jgi:hypothetical protein
VLAVDGQAGDGGIEPVGHPPVGLTQQFHCGRYEAHAHDGGVYQDGYPETQSEELHQGVGLEEEGQKTVTMIAAAAVITRAVAFSPSATVRTRVLTAGRAGQTSRHARQQSKTDQQISFRNR